jgi:hypothetical protein
MRTSRVIHVISEFEEASQKKLTAIAPSAFETAAKEFGAVAPNMTVDRSREAARNLLLRLLCRILMWNSSSVPLVNSLYLVSIGLTIG